MKFRRRPPPVFFPGRWRRWRPVVTALGWVLVFVVAFAFMVATVSRILDENAAPRPLPVPVPAAADHHGDG